MLDRQPVIGLAVEKEVHALNDVQFLFLQVTHHFVDEFSSCFAESRPIVLVGAVLQDVGGNRTKPRRHRFDRPVFTRQHAGEFTLAAAADQRKYDRLFERVVAEHVIERTHQVLELLLVLGPARIERIGRDRAVHPVLQAADRDENAEVLLVEDLPQFGQLGH